MKKYTAYGFYEGIMFTTKAPGIVLYSLRKEVKGKFNLKAKKEWERREK